MDKIGGIDYVSLLLVFMFVGMDVEDAILYSIFLIVLQAAK